MTPRKWMILGALLMLLTLGAEFVVRPWNSSRGCVQVVNQGDTPMDDVVVSYGETKVRVARIAAGQSTNVWLTGAGKRILTLEINQKGNPTKGFQVPDFDPAENHRNGFKIVLVVKNAQLERFMEDDESTTPLKSLKDTVIGWFDSDLRK